MSIDPNAATNPSVATDPNASIADEQPAQLVPARPPGNLPWAMLSLAVFAAGVLLILVRQETLQPNTLSVTVLWTAALLTAAAGGVRLAAQRDVVGWGTLFDGLVLVLSTALFSWMFPRFDTATIGWNQTERIHLTVLGAAVGALLASVVILGLIRRPPSSASAFYLAALALLLAAHLTMPWRLIMAAALVGGAFLALGLSWTARTTFDPPWTPPHRRLRIPRWILSLAAAGIAGTAIEEALSRDLPKQSTLSLILAGVIVVVALVSVLFSRTEQTTERGAFGDWMSQARQAHNADFEEAIHEYLPAPSRPLSEWTRQGELRLADDSFWTALGMSPQVDFHFGSIAHPEDRAPLARVLSQGIGHGLPMDHTFRAVHPTSGRERLIRLQGVPSQTGTILVEAHRVERGPAAFRIAASRIPGFDHPNQRNAVTGLRNTNFVDSWLQRYATENRRHTDNATLVIIESMPLDTMDTLSGGRRDLILTDVGHRLDAACRSGDFLAHLDGPYFLFGARLAIEEDRDGLLARVAELLSSPPAVDPPFHLDYRMVTLRVEPGVDLARVLGVAAAAFTSDL